MAKLPDLVSTLAARDERDPTTLEQFGRLLREDGVLPQSKRGFGASHMTAANAADLFMAVNGCSHPKDGPETVKRFRALRLEARQVVVSEGSPFEAVAQAETFGEALAQLINDMPAVVDYLKAHIEHVYGDNRTLVDASIYTLMHEFGWNGRSLPLPIKFTVTLNRHPYSAEILLQVHKKAGAANQRHPDFHAKYSPGDEMLDGFFGDYARSDTLRGTK